MNPYVFMTDSDSDLPFRYVDELDMTMVYMPYILDGKEYFDDLGRSGKQKEYFDNTVSYTHLTLPTILRV